MFLECNKQLYSEFVSLFYNFVYHILETSDKIKDWDLHIGKMCFALRTAVNNSTGFSPMYILTGQEPQTPFDNLLDIEIPDNKHCKDISNRMASIHNIVLDEITR